MNNELFTRLLYYGTVHLNRTEEETWLTPIGLLMDLWECHKKAGFTDAFIKYD